MKILSWGTRWVVGCLLIVGGPLAGKAAVGDSVIFPMDNAFSGSSPAGPAPWVNTWLTDGTPGTVFLSVSNVGITATEKVTALYLNLDPTLDPTKLQFTFLSGSSGVFAPLPSLGVDSFKADGDGKYDILFQFAQPPVSAFGANDYLTYKITGITGLNADDFIFLSKPSGGHGPFYAAAHVQSIQATSPTDTGTLSGWISPNEVDFLFVPEPSSSALFLLAACVGAVRFGLRRGKAAQAN